MINNSPSQAVINYSSHPVSFLSFYYMSVEYSSVQSKFLPLNHFFPPYPLLSSPPLSSSPPPAPLPQTKNNHVREVFRDKKCVESIRDTLIQETQTRPFKVCLFSVAVAQKIPINAENERLNSL